MLLRVYGATLLGRGVSFHPGCMRLRFGSALFCSVVDAAHEFFFNCFNYCGQLIAGTAKRDFSALSWGFNLSFPGICLKTWLGERQVSSGRMPTENNNRSRRKCIFFFKYIISRMFQMTWCSPGSSFLCGCDARAPSDCRTAPRRRVGVRRSASRALRVPSLPFLAEEKGERGEVLVAVHVHVDCRELKKLHWKVKLLS